jgi:hypothetical protein
VTPLAHGNGLDEGLVLGLPVVLFAVFFLLERRARRREAEQERDDPDR